MSDYQDDSNDTIYISDEHIAGLHTLAEDNSMKASDAVISGVGILLADTIVVSDEVQDSFTASITDYIHAADSVIDKQAAKQTVPDTFKIADRSIFRLRVNHADTVIASDSVIDRPVMLLVDTAIISDSVYATRKTGDTVVDSIKIKDFSWSPVSELAEDTILAADTFTGKNRVKILVAESITIADTIEDDSGAVVLAVDSITIADWYTDHLAAKTTYEDWLFAEDMELGDDSGAAWTANSNNWALSRYSGFNITEVFTIDDVAYGTGNDGLYRLEGGSSEVVGRVKTGKIRLAESLSHPTNAFIEYELAGATKESALTVGSTQSGSLQSFTYSLPAEDASEQTNGRFILGKGLRGSHFSFELSMRGTKGYINDWRVEFTPTKRAV